MTNNLIGKLKELYKGTGAYVRFYVKTRPRLLKLDYYSQFLPANGLLIDVGCGYGVMANYLALRFPAIQVLGIDLNQKRIAAALKTVDKRKNIAFSLQDARHCALPPCTTVLMTDFLHHIPKQDHEPILRTVFNSLKEEGTLILSEVDPTAKPIYRYWASYLSDRILYPSSKSYFRNPYELNNTLSQIGFNVKVTKPQNRLFAWILYICQKRGVTASDES